MNRYFKNKKGETFENYKNTVLVDTIINIEELEFYLKDIMDFKKRIEIHSNDRIEIQIRTEEERAFIKITMKFIKRV
jgi:hypothetical protein